MILGQTVCLADFGLTRAEKGGRSLERLGESLAQGARGKLLPATEGGWDSSEGAAIVCPARICQVDVKAAFTCGWEGRKGGADYPRDGSRRRRGKSEAAHLCPLWGRPLEMLISFQSSHPPPTAQDPGPETEGCNKSLVFGALAGLLKAAATVAAATAGRVTCGSRGR